MSFLRIFVVSAWLATAALGAAAQVSPDLEVSGAVRQTVSLDAWQLAAFPQEAIVQFVQTRSGQASPTSTVRGVKLAALVERAGLVTPGKNDWKSLMVIATATDGYRAIFSWAEITNTAVGDGVLVVFERDGQPLDDREGKIALMSTTDRQIGPRYVRNLARIEIQSIH
jgi:hypothetical protein